MGKKKKTYVKPEMKIIEVKTEGVIAASGKGEVDVTIEEFKGSCQNNWFNNGCGAPDPAVSNCEWYESAMDNTEYNSCLNSKHASIIPSEWEHVTLKKLNNTIYIYKGWIGERK